MVKQNWLADRKEKVTVKEGTSAWTTDSQDSVLGALLFDLENGVASSILRFADDANIFRRVETRRVSRPTGRFG